MNSQSTFLFKVLPDRFRRAKRQRTSQVCSSDDRTDSKTLARTLDGQLVREHKVFERIRSTSTCFHPGASAEHHRCLDLSTDSPQSATCIDDWWTATHVTGHHWLLVMDTCKVVGAFSDHPLDCGRPRPPSLLSMKGRI